MKRLKDILTEDSRVDVHIQRFPPPLHLQFAEGFILPAPGGSGAVFD